MQIEFPSQSAGTIDRVPRVQFDRNDINTPHFIYLLPAPQTLSRHERLSPLSFYSNLVDVTALWPLQLETSWAVYQHSTAVFRETSLLRPAATSSYAYRYACDLVPAFWSTLCQCEGKQSRRFASFKHADLSYSRSQRYHHRSSPQDCRDCSLCLQLTCRSNSHDVQLHRDRDFDRLSLQLPRSH